MDQGSVCRAGEMLELAENEFLEMGFAVREYQRKDFELQAGYFWSVRRTGEEVSGVSDEGVWAN